MKLFGSYTSPYVRRVRILAMERDVPFEMIDSATESGQRELRAHNPLWKVPAAEIDGVELWDSHSIIQFILEKRGYGKLRPSPPVERWRETNLITVIDGALDSAINAFYYEKDGAKPSEILYLNKQKLRVKAAMEFLSSELNGPWFTPDKNLGLSEIYLYTALDWMRFRKTYPVSEIPVFAEFLEAHQLRNSIAETSPPG